MNAQLVEKILRVPQLPTLPAIAVKVLDLARQNDISVTTVAKVISSDPALSAKVLKTVNSSFYSLSHQVSTINHALVLLGIQTVKTLALGFSLAGSLNSRKSSKFDYVRFWRQSLFSAVAARTLAREREYKEPEEAFLTGLLSDIGTLAMHWAIGPEYDLLLESCGGDQIELVQQSRAKFDLDHAQVGAAMAENWKFPASMIEPIRQHHNLTAGGCAPDSLTELVYAGVLCGQVFASKRGGLVEKARQELVARFGWEESKIHSLFFEIESRASELAHVFEIQIEPGRTYADIEQEARQTLVEITLQSQLQSRQMELQNQKLRVQASTDGLTGLANRGRFNQFMRQAFEEMRASGQPLSLLFLDIDNFKSINDTFGHQAGDSVLERIGDLLKTRLEETQLAARYGGEEFAIVLPATDAPAALDAAEQLREAIETEAIPFDAQPIAITASIGVTTADSISRFSTPDEMVGAADKAVYAAKEAGRNCVRTCAGSHAVLREIHADLGQHRLSA